MSEFESPDHENKLMQKLIREPTVHFLLIAAVVFAIHALSRAGGESTLEIDAREIEARIFLQEMSSGQALTETQRQAIADNYIEEQILVREALAMDLDNDARIHDMLAQKMRHVLSGDLIQPTQAQLQDYYQSNLERYRIQPRVNVDELVFNNREALPENVISSLQAGAEPEALLAMAEGSNAPLPDVSRQDLGNIFSEAFAERVFNADAGQWVGPFASNRGQHWLRTTGRSPARVPALAEIEDQVRLEWIIEEEEALLQQEINRLREQYSIIITENGAEE